MSEVLAIVARGHQDQVEDGGHESRTAALAISNSPKKKSSILGSELGEHLRSTWTDVPDLKRGEERNGGKLDKVKGSLTWLRTTWLCTS